MKSPIWNSPSDYDYADSLSKEGWAWEFLRRNAKYEEEYTEVRKRYAQAKELFGPFEDNEEKWRNYDPVIVKNPFLEHGDSPGAWNGRVWDKNIAPEWTYLEVQVAGRWGLKHKLQDPQKDTPPIFRYPYDHPKYMTEEAKEYFLPLRPSPEQPEPAKSQFISIGFDLALPIDKQLSKAKEILQDQRKYRKIAKTKNKTAPRLWKDYLIVLDGIMALKYLPVESRIEEIANFLFRSEPTELKQRSDWLAEKVEKTKATLRQARKMRDQNYLLILRSGKSN
ncbi:MAG: DUF6499 domain-containing protein [Hyphomicrobiales bacterium]